MTNQNQTDTNEMATTEIKYLTDFYSAEKNTNMKPNFNIECSQNADTIPRKYQEIWDRNTKYRFGFGIFLVYQIIGYRLTSLRHTMRPGERCSGVFTGNIATCSHLGALMNGKRPDPLDALSIPKRRIFAASVLIYEIVSILRLP